MAVLGSAFAFHATQHSGRAAVPIEVPTDALLDFASALQRALRGVDTSGSMGQVNTELAAAFDGFRVHPAADGCGLVIEPVLHADVARAILEGSMGSTVMAAPFLVPSKPPPMEWLATAIESQDYTQT